MLHMCFRHLLPTSFPYKAGATAKQIASGQGTQTHPGLSFSLLTHNLTIGSVKNRVPPYIFEHPYIRSSNSSLDSCFEGGSVQYQSAARDNPQKEKPIGI